ncbi:hypothetical protein BJV82DRAFT_666331 [Fennellomyces sp. T-0311]|nr:hypothetical protein BJV82DRAFT_666331 [Fennellomyces sp. T-0311]
MAQMDHMQFVTQAYPTFDPAAHAMYYNDMAPGADGRVTAYPQFNLQFSPGHVHPQHEHQARRLHQLQQHAAFQQQQAIYHQQMMAYQHHYQVEHPISPGKRMQTKAERRAEHNAIERARRENLNTKFQQLAHSLPNLQNDRRPSKGTIIERTLDFVKSTVMKEEKFLSEIRKLREEHEELKQQLNPGHQRNSSASDADDSDGSSTTSARNAVERLSLSSASCPSLELSSTSPPLPPSSGLDSTNFFGTTSYNGMLSNPLQNDVMFGPDPQQQPMVLSGTNTYESDDDYSSANLDDIDQTSTDLSSFPSMVNLPPSTDYMNKMSPSPATVPSSDYEFKFEPQQQQQQH